MPQNKSLPTSCCFSGHSQTQVSKATIKQNTQDIRINITGTVPQGFLRELLAAGPFHPRSRFSYLDVERRVNLAHVSPSLHACLHARWSCSSLLFIFGVFYLISPGLLGAFHGVFVRFLGCEAVCIVFRCGMAVM